MKQTLSLLGEFTALNEYINLCRQNKYEAHEVKISETDRVVWECKAKRLLPFPGMVHISYAIYTKNRKHDPDNMLLTIKFINDGLVRAGVIKNDTMNYVTIKNISVQNDGNGARTEVLLED